MRKFFFFLFCCTATLTADYTAKDYTSLLGMKGFNDDLLKMHFQLYQGYVKNVNLLLNSLQNYSLTTPLDTYEFGALKRRLGWEFDGMRLHELYFENLGGQNGPPTGQSPIYTSLTKQFGSFDAWKADFIATALMRGIGWVILLKEQATGKLINVWIDSHDIGHLVTLKPILVLDVWEHAYLTQYGLDRAAYVNAFLDNVDWTVVEKRLVAR